MINTPLPFQEKNPEKTDISPILWTKMGPESWAVSWASSNWKLPEWYKEPQGRIRSWV